MAQDIKKLFKNNSNLENDKMPQGHETRFLNKLDEELPEAKKSNFRWYSIAASVVLFMCLSVVVYQFFQPEDIRDPNRTIVDNTKPETKTLGDVSPDLRKVEDYYVANINLELSKVKLTPQNKDLFDSYVLRLEELNKEYDMLSVELTQDGPNEQTVDALINNLKLRLNLLYRFKEQLKDLNEAETIQSI